MHNNVNSSFISMKPEFRSFKGYRHSLHSIPIIGRQTLQMNGPVDWNQRREQFERNLENASPERLMDHIVAPAIITIEIDHTEKQFDRLGYLRCAKPKISLGEQVLHLGIHQATMKLNEEKINNLSRLWSPLVVQNIKSHIYTQLKAVMINSDVEKIKRILEPQLTAERRLSEVSAGSLAAEIRSRLEAVEPLYLDAHATECKDLMIPYGAELTVTTKGALKIVRRFSIDRHYKNVKWRGGFDVSVVLNVDASIDPSFDATKIEVRGFEYPIKTELEEKDQSDERVQHALHIAKPTILYDENYAGKWPSLAFDPEGNPHIAFLVQTGSKYSLKYIKWDEDIKSWTDPPEDLEPSGVLDLPPSLAIDTTDSTPRITYTARENGEDRLYFAKKTWDQARQKWIWEKDIVDTDVDSARNNNSLVLDGQNYPHICYVAKKGAQMRLLHQYEDQQGWHGRGNDIIWVDKLWHDFTFYPYGCSLAFDSDGILHISYLAGPGHVKYAKFDKGIDDHSWIGTTILDDNQDTFGDWRNDAHANMRQHFRSVLAIDSWNDPHIVLQWLTKLKHYFRKNSIWQEEEIETFDTPTESVEPSIAIDKREDKIKVSYWYGYPHQQNSHPNCGWLRIKTKSPDLAWSDIPTKDVDQQGDTLDHQGEQGDVGHFSSIAIHPQTRKTMVAYHSDLELTDHVIGRNSPTNTAHGDASMVPVSRKVTTTALKFYIEQD